MEFRNFFFSNCGHLLHFDINKGSPNTMSSFRMEMLFHTFSSLLGCCTLTTDQYFDVSKECCYLFTSLRGVTFMKTIICIKTRSESLMRRISAYIFAVWVTIILNPVSLVLQFEGTSSPADTYMLTIAQ